MPGESDKKERFQKKFEKDQVGKPFATDRESVEEGQEREGTNLDLGEERSEEQMEQMRELDEDREG